MPERTADAWIAISLASQGAKGLWFATPNAQSIENGFGQPDIAISDSSRVLLLEVKGIEGSEPESIDLGGKHEEQVAHFMALQELGALFEEANSSWIGWAFFALPWRGGWTPHLWPDYPDACRCVCPFALQERGKIIALQKAELVKLACPRVYGSRCPVRVDGIQDTHSHHWPYVGGIIEGMRRKTLGIEVGNLRTAFEFGPPSGTTLGVLWDLLGQGPDQQQTADPSGGYGLEEALADLLEPSDLDLNLLVIVL